MLAGWEFREKGRAMAVHDCDEYSTTMSQNTISQVQSHQTMLHERPWNGIATQCVLSPLWMLKGRRSVVLCNDVYGEVFQHGYSEAQASQGKLR
eukprot:scaffold175690_cov30-Prasinocladus_malaysianus.AAC.1